MIMSRPLLLEGLNVNHWFKDHVVMDVPLQPQVDLDCRVEDVGVSHRHFYVKKIFSPKVG